MAAYFGIAIAYPILERFLFGPDQPSKVLAGIIQGLVVQLICLPIGIFNFGYVTFIGIFSSMLLSPSVGIIMLGGLLSGASKILAIPTNLLAKIHLLGINFFSKINFATIELESNNVVVFTTYVPVVVFLTTAYILNSRAERRRLELAKIQKYGKIYAC